MCALEVRLVKLPPMRVAAVHALSAAPEREAWDALRAWARPRGLLDNPREHPVYGFNNPNPSPGCKEYGYELWIRVGPETAAESPVATKEFPGGLYAMTTCRLNGDVSLPEVWKALWDWALANNHKWRHTHELEQVRNPGAAEEDMILDLYLPVED